MYRRLFALPAAALAAAVLAYPAAAGGCLHRSAECYEKVKAPDVYRTVAKPVVVAPGRTEVVSRPAVVVDRPERVELVPASASVVHTPAVYGTVHRTVEVAPARAHVAWTPAVYATRHRDVVVSPGIVRWERRIDAHSRETMCKVSTPAVTRTIAEKVLVAPPRRRVHVTPAVHRDVAQTIVVREAATRTVLHPAVYAWRSRPVVIAPATRQVIQHPPVIGYRHETQLVGAAATPGARQVSATGKSASTSGLARRLSAFALAARGRYAYLSALR